MSDVVRLLKEKLVFLSRDVYKRNQSFQKVLKWAELQPGVIYCGLGYFLFEISIWRYLNNVPLDLYWVDYFRMYNAYKEVIRGKMLAGARYHVLHFPEKPEFFKKLRNPARIEKRDKNGKLLESRVAPGFVGRLQCDCPVCNLAGTPAKKALT